MPADDLGQDLAEVSREVRAAFRDEREMVEEASEQLARKEADLVDVVLDAMHRGQPLQLRVGPAEFVGTVVHIADDLAILNARGAQVDVRLSALSEIRILDPVPGAGRALRRDVPACFDDCLEGLEATGREVELGGPDLPAATCRVMVVARDHVVLEGRGLVRVVPLAGVGFVIRRP